MYANLACHKKATGVASNENTAMLISVIYMQIHAHGHLRKPVNVYLQLTLWDGFNKISAIDSD